MVKADESDNLSNQDSDSGDSSGSEALIDSVIDNIIANFSLYSTPTEKESNMTIKNKSKKERKKVERSERHDRSDREQIEKPGTSTGVPYPYPYQSYSFAGADSQIHQLTLPESEFDSLNAEQFSYSPYDTEQGTFSVSHNQTHKRRHWNPSQGHEKPNKQQCEIRPLSTNKIVHQTPDDGSGNNSEDEYYNPPKCHQTTQEEIEAENDLERLLMEKKGWRIVRVGTDGACLFRSVSNQIFGDEEKHDIVRSQVLDYMTKNREHFSQYVTEDYDNYLKRKREPACHGNHLEIQAIAELYNRPVEIYHDSVEPINVFHSEYKTEAPIRLSYHGHVHYNSVMDPYNPCIGIGLGMPNYQPGLPEPDLIKRAIAESENFQIEQAMLHDKLKETEKFDLERNIEEQVARESYLEYLSQLKPRRSSGKPRSLTSSPPHHPHFSSPLPTTSSKRSPPHPNTADKSEAAVHPQSSPLYGQLQGAEWASTDADRGACAGTSLDVGCGAAGGLPGSQQDISRLDQAIVDYVPPEMLDMDESTMMALVMEESRRDYIESLKSKNNNSPDQATTKSSSSPLNDVIQKPGCSKDNN